MRRRAPVAKGVFCPSCKCDRTFVRHTKRKADGTVRRYRSCRGCDRHFSTLERVDGSVRSISGTSLLQTAAMPIAPLRKPRIVEEQEEGRHVRPDPPGSC
jgi:hypothetical protein